MKIDFVGLKTQYNLIKDDVMSAIIGVLENTAFVAGPYVRQFEESFAAAHDIKYCIGVNSGTSALHSALLAMGTGPGDEIIIPTNTFFATPEAVSLTGATPIFVDCDKYCNIDITKIADKITSRTVGVIAVHLYGQPADLDNLVAVTNKHGIFLIEDCAQAHLAEYKNKKVGSFGVCGCFSFYPSKNLGAYGEAGAVVTNDISLYNTIMKIRDHGSSKKYYHDIVGHNYRMAGFQGAILNVKLKYLSEWTSARIYNAAVYKKYLRDIFEISIIENRFDVKHVYHLFVIKCTNRSRLIEYLSANNIYTSIHYPIPCHMQEAYKFLHTDCLPVAENNMDNILSLPMYPELSEDEIKHVVLKIKEFYGGANKIYKEGMNK